MVSESLVLKLSYMSYMSVFTEFSKLNYYQYHCSLHYYYHYKCLSVIQNNHSLSCTKLTLNLPMTAQCQQRTCYKTARQRSTADIPLLSMITPSNSEEDEKTSSLYKQVIAVVLDTIWFLIYMPPKMWHYCVVSYTM